VGETHREFYEKESFPSAKFLINKVTAYLSTK
jgi:hypothetical protein